MWERIKDGWLTWRTGLDKKARDYFAWEQAHIVHRADTVDNYFQGFKHIIALDYKKVYTEYQPMFGMYPNAEFLSYMYPNRPLGNNCAYRDFRGTWNQWDKRFHITDFGDTDHTFIATNNEEDAIMLALKWG